MAQPGTTRRRADPYGDPRQYAEPPGYSRPPGYDDEPGHYPYGGPDPRDGYRRSRSYDRPEGYEQPDGYDEPEDFDEPDGYDQPGEPERDDSAAPGRLLRRPGRSRAAAARRRRSKRRLLTWGGLAVLIVAAVGVSLYLTKSPGKKPPYVTNLQKGEVRAVPSACKVLNAATLHQLMSGTPKSQPIGGGLGQSQCTFTVDVKPAFRILQVQEQAFPPSVGVPSGNGSATANAVWNFSQAKGQLTKPPKHSVWPPASITQLTGLGDQAISAEQASHGRIVTDRVTVLVRYRNVLITVQEQAQESGGFGPVPASVLRSAALTAARDIFAAVRREPTA